MRRLLEVAVGVIIGLGLTHLLIPPANASALLISSLHETVKVEQLVANDQLIITVPQSVNQGGGPFARTAINTQTTPNGLNMQHKSYSTSRLLELAGIITEDTRIRARLPHGFHGAKVFRIPPGAEEITPNMEISYEQAMHLVSTEDFFDKGNNVLDSDNQILVGAPDIETAKAALGKVFNIFNETTATNQPLQQHSYTFYIIDPQNGEFTKYYSGSVVEIVQLLRKDPENSMIADVLSKQNFSQLGGKNGILSFAYDGHVYSFIPN